MAAFNCELRQNTGASFADIIYLKTIPAMVDGLLSGGKIADNLLPNYVFGGMRYITIFDDNVTNTAGIKTIIDNYISTNGGTHRGCYLIVQGIQELTLVVSTGHTVKCPLEGIVEQSGDVVMQSGDWIICDNDTGTQYSIVNNTYVHATTVLAGLMSPADKTKLDGIETNANNYSHPTQSAIDGNATDDGISVVDRVQVNTLGHVTSVTTRNLAAATTSTPGHMTAADKTKLDGIETGANLYTHPTGGANVNISATTIETIASVIVNTLGHVTAFTKQTIRSASTSQTGIVEIATDAEMKAGSSGTLVGSAASVKAAIDFFATLPVYASLSAANTDAVNQPTGKLALVIV